MAPSATLGLAGVTAIETSVIGGTTVIVVLPVTVPEVAEIVDVPSASAVAIPPGAIDATVVSDEAQVAVAVRSCVL